MVSFLIAPVMATIALVGWVGGGSTSGSALLLGASAVVALSVGLYEATLALRDLAADFAREDYDAAETEALLLANEKALSNTVSAEEAARLNRLRAVKP